MRQRYLRSPIVQNYTILVRDVPKEVDCRTVRFSKKNKIDIGGGKGRGD